MNGSFWITKTAITILIDSGASALEIAVYLIIAKHTDVNGVFSTAGYNSLKKYVGVNNILAKKTVEKLLNLKTNHGSLVNLLYTAEYWQKITGQTIKQVGFEQAEIRFIVNDFNADPSDRIWFCNNLIEGYGKFTTPLKRLRVCGDVAARLLLLGYRDNDFEQFGGINPKTYSCIYDMKHITTACGYDLWEGVFNQIYASGDWRKVVGNKFCDISEASALFISSINSLDKAGFLYQVVTVFDRSVDSDETQAIYELNVKSLSGYYPVGEDGLGLAIAYISEHLGNKVTDSQDRLYHKYAAISPYGTPFIIGIYRLRFRVANPRNFGVSAGWARIHQDQKIADNWVSELDRLLNLSN